MLGIVVSAASAMLLLGGALAAEPESPDIPKTSTTLPGTRGYGPHGDPRGLPTGLPGFGTPAVPEDEKKPRTVPAPPPG